METRYFKIVDDRLDTFEIYSRSYSDYRFSETCIKANTNGIFTDKVIEIDQAEFEELSKELVSKHKKHKSK